ncbi:MAG: protein phosphatase 2C domain-containing protein, partial [Trueperaceae bacterium]
RPLLLVADGMGGHNTGEVASAHATEVVRARLEENRAHPPMALAKALQAANRQVLAQARSDPRHEGMGTTLTAILIDDSVGLVAHVGDTRAYLLRDGALHPLTQDHSWVAERVRQGLLSEDEARHHRWRNVITNALGATERFRLDLAHVRLRPGDRLLVASDGLTSLLADAVLYDTAASGTPEEAVEALLDAADARGSPDNVSAVVADVVEVQVRDKPYDLPAEAPWTVEVGATQTGIREVEDRYPGRGPMTWMRKQAWYPYRLWIVGSAYLAFLLVLFVAMR